ncbi:MAG TPA: four helix bundle protein [Prolixibacteraceae bacterium]|jgi:four helix bundle protein|nr:four helix bundle protein [Prolixibacteraceae bacterium]
MENKEFAKKLERRTKIFAISIIRLSSALSNRPEARVIRNQITKSGTSVGANYREANRSRSKADFSNKITICEGAASETGYWLELIEELAWAESGKVNAILAEANELLAIFTSIGTKLV